MDTPAPAAQEQSRNRMIDRMNSLCAFTSEDQWTEMRGGSISHYITLMHSPRQTSFEFPLALGPPP